MFTWPTLCLESPQALLTGRADVYMADALSGVTTGTADRKGRCLHGRRSAWSHRRHYWQEGHMFTWPTLCLESPQALLTGRACQMFTWLTLCLESLQALLTGRADVYMTDTLRRVTAGTADRKGESSANTAPVAFCTTHPVWTSPSPQP